MTNNYVVDIIIPFNEIHSYLFDAIKSARASVGIDIRIILINDTQSEIDLSLFELNNKDRLLKNNGSGYVDALKTGVDASTAGYVAFLDSDDLTDPRRILLQIEELLRANVDYVTGKLMKFTDSNPMPNNRLILGKMPRNNRPELLLLLGAHGADSSILAKGDSLREGWSKHSVFSAPVADYGWLLSNLISGQNLTNLPTALYFYRTHGNQMSRNNSLVDTFHEVWPLWNDFRLQRLPELRRFNSIEFTIDIALAITFPSALKKLSFRELRLMKTAIIFLLSDLKELDTPDYASWKKTLWRRYFIAGKSRAFTKYNYGVSMLFDFVLLNLKGMQTRVNA